MKNVKLSLSLLLGMFLLSACIKDEEPIPNTPHPFSEGKAVFRFSFDSEQERLNNLGQPSTIPDGHAAQSPNFKGIGAHYIELVPSIFTPVGQGQVIYVGEETTLGGDTAIHFSQSKVCEAGEEFFQIPLDDIEPGTYSHIRVSLSYQSFDIDFLWNGNDLEGTLAGFIGYNTYIDDFTIDQEIVTVNENKLQGYWGFETVGVVTTGQAPAGATTVVNPLFDSAPIPAGSCIVTGEFPVPIVIDSNNEGLIMDVTFNLSTNQSFEWQEVNEDGKFEPDAGENVVDMGIRGMVPEVVWAIE